MHTDLVCPPRLEVHANMRMSPETRDHAIVRYGIATVGSNRHANAIRVMPADRRVHGTAGGHDTYAYGLVGPVHLSSFNLFDERSVGLDRPRNDQQATRILINSMHDAR